MQSSVFNNFFAEKFNKFPEKRYCRIELNDASRDWLSEHVTKESNVWLFGLAPVLTQGNQSTFGYPDALLSADHTYRSLIPDSWFDTLGFLVSVPKDENPITVILTIGFLASVSDPRPVLLAYKMLALQRRTSCIILFHPHDDYVRQWSLKNFLQFLNVSGFEVINTSTIDETYISISISFDAVLQQTAVTNAGIKATASDVTTLVVSIADTPSSKTTDILFDIQNIMQFSQHSICLTNISERDEIYNSRCLTVKELVGDISKEDLVDGIALIEAVKAALYLLPSLRVIEIYSEDTIAFRVIQAKRTGQLPQYLTITTTSLNLIDHAKAQLHNRTAMNYEIAELRELVRQAFIFKYADISYFRSNEVVRLLQEEFGYPLRNPRVRRMPLGLSNLKKIDSAQVCFASVLIVMVNVEQENDWKNLLNFIKQLIKPIIKIEIREVIFLTKISPPASDLLDIKNLVKCSWHQLTSIETVQSHCTDFQSRGIFLIQTSSDEFFDAIWLMKVYGCRFFLKQDAENLFYKIENEKWHSNFYKLVSTDAAAEQFSLGMKEPLERQCLRVADVQARSLDEQCITNKRYLENEWKDLVSVGYTPEYFLDVSLVSPVFNTQITYLQDLFQSLEVSAIQPKEWILINDGSTSEYLIELEAFVLERSTNHLPIRLISQKNGGLAAARNLGLAVSTTSFTYFLDSDDVLLPHTLSDALVAMWVDPQYVVVAGLLVYFSEKQNLLDDVTIHRISSYWPAVGIPENKALGLIENDYISASGLFNTQLMRKAGGWDASDKATWEDWALYNKLAWSGAEFCLIPNVGHLYRDTPGSMAKTYNPYFGRRRLVRNMPGINKFDSHILYALTNQEMTKAEHQKTLDLIYSSRSWRITRPLRIVLKLLRLDFSAAWGVYKNKDR